MQSVCVDFIGNHECLPLWEVKDQETESSLVSDNQGKKSEGDDCSVHDAANLLNAVSTHPEHVERYVNWIF